LLEQRSINDCLLTLMITYKNSHLLMLTFLLTFRTLLFTDTKLLIDFSLTLELVDVLYFHEWFLIAASFNYSNLTLLIQGNIQCIYCSNSEIFKSSNFWCYHISVLYVNDGAPSDRLGDTSLFPMSDNN